jgi:hypothetical protein
LHCHCQHKLLQLNWINILIYHRHFDTSCLSTCLNVIVWILKAPKKWVKNCIFHAHKTFFILSLQVGFGNVAAETDNEKVFTIIMMIIACRYINENFPSLFTHATMCVYLFMHILEWERDNYVNEACRRDDVVGRWNNKLRLTTTRSPSRNCLRPLSSKMAN